MRFSYPADLLEESDGVTITFPDVPGAISHGATRAEALHRGAEALVSLLADMAEAGEELPRPGPARGRPLVSVTATEAAKLALNEAMRAQGISNVALAARLGVDEKAARRLRDVLHGSRMPEIERALAALGKRVTLDVRDAA